MHADEDYICKIDDFASFVEGALPHVMTKILLPCVKSTMKEYKPELVEVHRVSVYLLGGFSS